MFGVADTVVILEAATLRLVHTLVFSESFPSASVPVSSVAVYSPAKLVGRFALEFKNVDEFKVIDV